MKKLSLLDLKKYKNILEKDLKNAKKQYEKNKWDSDKWIIITYEYCLNIFKDIFGEEE